MIELRIPFFLHQHINMILIRQEEGILKCLVTPRRPMLVLDIDYLVVLKHHLSLNRINFV
jgi:hypothetical protein